MSWHVTFRSCKLVASGQWLPDMRLRAGASDALGDGPGAAPRRLTWDEVRESRPLARYGRVRKYENECKTMVSESETAISETETAVSEFESIVSEFETAVSGSKTVVSESETAVSESDTAVSKSETVVSESETAVSQSERVRKRMGTKMVVKGTLT